MLLCGGRGEKPFVYIDVKFCFLLLPGVVVRVEYCFLGERKKSFFYIDVKFGFLLFGVVVRVECCSGGEGEKFLYIDEFSLHRKLEKLRVD